MASIFSELIRRNVLRSAALYLAATWLILQVADLVLEAFDASPGVMRMLIIAFTAGFPVFLLLSWFYEFKGARLVKDSGESANAPQRWSSRMTNVAIAVLAVLGLGIYLYSQTVAVTGPAEPGTGHAETPDAGYSIAVMPLANISNDPADEYLADGLTEELVNVLTSVPQLRVTARASSFALKGTEQDAVSIGEKLGVGPVLAGSVRKDGDQLRIPVRRTIAN